MTNSDRLFELVDELKRLTGEIDVEVRELQETIGKYLNKGD